MDIDMPVMNGIDATQKALEINPDLKIMVLTMFGDEKYYVKMIEAGAKGFLLKSSNKNELETAVREVASGQTYFSNELLRKIIARIGMPVKSNKSEDEVHNFSERETEIIQHMCQGLTTSEIAEKLFLSAKTVENYRVRLLQKTGCKNAVSLVVYAIKNKIVVI
jgi:DNA-binding NarL/FixJ family response regulator